MSLLEDALAAHESTPPATPIDVDVELGGKLLPFRFYPLSGEDWAEITALCPIRLGSEIDMKYGYNFNAACRLSAPKSGRLVDGDEEQSLDDAQWAGLFSKLPGHAVKLIHSAIWELNEYAPEVRVAHAKKGSARASSPKPS